MAHAKTARPVRIGVFADVASADQAVRGLLAAGFTKDEISVVCSDQSKERHFREFEHAEPAGTTTTGTATAGSVLGAMAGGLLAVSGIVATGGLALVAAGAFFVGAGAVAGTFIGAMMSRGFEDEIANFYDQALRDGDLLVAAEIPPEGDRERLVRAEQVFRDAGARPLPLPKG